jgi:uncharacterized protein (DUF169 family)
MVDYDAISDRIVEILGLKNLPVAVTLIKDGMEVPPEYKIPEKNISHCQTIMAARKGEFLYIPADRHGCLVGASSLGLVETPEKVKSGEFHQNLNMFGSSDAAKKMIDDRYEFEYGSNIGTAVSPLKGAILEPDVVVFIGLPEQIYWLIPAWTFNEGGRANVSTAAFQATCVDATIIPILTGKLNLSLGCFGCRRRTDIAPESMLAGIPAGKLEEVVAALEIIGNGPIQKARKLDKK